MYMTEVMRLLAFWRRCPTADMVQGWKALGEDWGKDPDKPKMSPQAIQGLIDSLGGKGGVLSSATSEAPRG